MFSSVDFETNKLVKKHFKQKRFHPRGEATSCPVKTSARKRVAPGNCFLQKKEINGGGCTVSYFFLSLHIIKVWRQKSTHVCVFSFVSYCTTRSQPKRREENRTEGAVRECIVLLSPLCVYLYRRCPAMSCSISEWPCFLFFTVL